MSEKQALRYRPAGPQSWIATLKGCTGAFDYFLRRMGEDNIANTAAALCYFTALSVVPALAVVLGALTAFPAFDRLRTALQSVLLANLVPDLGLRIQTQLESFVAAAGKLTAVGVLGLLATAIMLLLTVEGAFNRIFRVSHNRPILLRLVVLWTVLTISPFMTALSLSLYGYFAAVRIEGPFAEVVSLLLGQLVPTLVTWALLSFLYIAVPNRRVHWRDAFIGAAVSAVGLEILRNVFGVYIKATTSYSAIYGTIAAVPVFLVWVYFVWAVIMAGTVITAALPDWRLLRRGLATGPAQKLALALELLSHLSTGFRVGTALRLEQLALAIGVPEAGLLPVLEELRSAHYVAVIETGLWVLSRDLAHIPMVELVHGFGFGVGPAADALCHSEFGRRVCRRLDEAVKSEQQLLGMSLAEVVAPDENGGSVDKIPMATAP